MYKYKCTSKFCMLLFIDGTIVEVRPNQIIDTKSKLDYKYMKIVSPKKKEIKNANKTSS